jgi:hypothetical protein
MARQHTLIKNKVATWNKDQFLSPSKVFFFPRMILLSYFVYDIMG